MWRDVIGGIADLAAGGVVEKGDREQGLTHVIKGMGRYGWRACKRSLAHGGVTYGAQGGASPLVNDKSEHGFVIGVRIAFHLLCVVKGAQPWQVTEPCPHLHLSVPAIATSCHRHKVQMVVLGAVAHTMCVVPLMYEGRTGALSACRAVILS